jgi:hypothetical protein
LRAQPVVRVLHGAVLGIALHVGSQPKHAAMPLLQPSSNTQPHNKVTRTTRSWKKSARSKQVNGVASEPVLPLGKRSADVLGDVARSVTKRKKGNKSVYALSLVDEVEAKAVSQPRHPQ